MTCLFIAATSYVLFYENGAELFCPMREKNSTSPAITAQKKLGPGIMIKF